MSCKLIDANMAAEFLSRKQDILILTHQNPDGDTLGSAYALGSALRAMGKRSRVLCPDEIPSKFSFLMSDEQLVFEPQTIIAVDVADDKLLGQLKSEYQDRIELCIDHHGTNTQYAKSLYLEPDAAAACECVYKVIKSLGVKITPFIATALYLGMATDTGCFKFSNTTPDTHRFAAELMELGATSYEINRVMFETKSKARIELERQVIEGIEFWFDGRCAVITVTEQMIKSTGCEQTDLDGVTALSRQIEGVSIGVTLKQKGDNHFKVSVRTFEPYDAAAICAEFGGGGHKRAAGCDFFLSLDQTKQKLKEKLATLLG